MSWEGQRPDRLPSPACRAGKKGDGRRHQGQRPGRLHDVRKDLIPHVSLIDFDLVLLAYESILFLKRKLCVVLFLISDVCIHRVTHRMAHGKCSIAGLPRKR